MNCLKNKIISICNNIYKQLGPGHNENIYHKALMYELCNLHIKVDTEKHIYVKYMDLCNVEHTLVSERIDLYLHEDINSPFDDLKNSPIILELKAISKTISSMEDYQVIKYFRELYKEKTYPKYGIIINFQQPSNKFIMTNAVDYRIVNNDFIK